MKDEGSSGSAIEVVASRVTRRIKSLLRLRSSSECFHLSVDLVDEILGNLDEMDDRIKLGAVCKHWRSAVRSPILPRVRLPWLLLRPHDNQTLKFRIISSKKTYSISHDLDHGLIRRTVSTSDSGWLLMFNLEHRDTSPPPLCPLLFNPITRARIPLPEFPFNFIFWSSNISFSPKDKSLVVMMSFGANWLYCCRLLKAAEKPTEWTIISVSDVLGARESTCSFTYHRGFYFILGVFRCSTAIVDPHTNKLVSVIPPPLGMIHAFFNDTKRWLIWSLHLVQSTTGDDLFLVITPSIDTIKRFEVFRWDSTVHENKWSKVKSIGSSTLFKSSDAMMALPATNNSSTSIRENCIVFFDGGLCLHLFDIGNDSVEPLLCSWDSQTDSRGSQWFLPVQ